MESLLDTTILLLYKSFYIYDHQINKLTINIDSKVNTLHSMALFNITRPESIMSPLCFPSRKVKIQFSFIAVCKYNILSSWLGKALQLNHLLQHCFLVTGTFLLNNKLTTAHFQGLFLKCDSYFTTYLFFIEMTA